MLVKHIDIHNCRYTNNTHVSHISQILYIIYPIYGIYIIQNIIWRYQNKYHLYIYITYIIYTSYIQKEGCHSHQKSFRSTSPKDVRHSSRLLHRQPWDLDICYMYLTPPARYQISAPMVCFWWLKGHKFHTLGGCRSIEIKNCYVLCLLGIKNWYMSHM